MPQVQVLSPRPITSAPKFPIFGVLGFALFKKGFFFHCLGVAESVKSFECQLLLVAEFVQPSVRFFGMKRFSVPTERTGLPLSAQLRNLMKKRLSAFTASAGTLNCRFSPKQRA